MQGLHVSYTPQLPPSRSSARSFCCSQNQLGWERLLRQSPTCDKHHLVNWTPDCQVQPLKSTKDDYSTTPLSTPLRYLITLSVRKLLLMLSLNHPRRSLRLCPRPVTRRLEKTPTPRDTPSFQAAGYSDKTSLLSLLFSKIKPPSATPHRPCDPNPVRPPPPFSRHAPAPQCPP